ncbi:phage terminase small subunit P27 family [Rhizobium sp. BE258]|uniref:phage terminase small subunit P27 family n=1 Tax=Rhizobium sp. BE258 TaxID=2817722 RepID=UPI002867A52A|nr:phage terminase small subunit P27 family [Rhizobium sp. BE258]MDR7147051.1 P27 family predicted phage terminase small subunit [Rhizobium sp. BE258]
MRGKKAHLKAVDGGLSGVPKAPACIPDELVAEWDACGADMAARQILTASALGLLETYILARYQVRECHAAIKDHGLLVPTAHGMRKPNPASGMLKAALEAVARLSAELGISPAARSKPAFNPKEGGKDDGWSDMDL